MKSQEEMKVILEEEIHRAIEEATEGLLKFHSKVWIETEEFVNFIIREALGEGEEGDEQEELCPDMDHFLTEEE